MDDLTEMLVPKLTLAMVVDHVSTLRTYYRRQLIRHDSALLNGEIDAVEHAHRVATLVDFVGVDTVAMWTELGQLGAR